MKIHNHAFKPKHSMSKDYILCQFCLQAKDFHIIGSNNRLINREVSPRGRAGDSLAEVSLSKGTLLNEKNAHFSVIVNRHIHVSTIGI